MSENLDQFLRNHSITHSALAMASTPPVISQSQPFFNKPQSGLLRKPHANFFLSFSLKKSRMVMVSAKTAAEKPEKRFVEEMRSAALKLHTREETKEGEREPDGPPIARWKPSIKGYLKFLVDSSLVYQTLERAVDKAAFPEYTELRKSGLERSESIGKDVEWFKKQGHGIPQPSPLGINYAQYLDDLSQSDPQAFICHFYMIHFGHNAGGKMIGKKIEKLLKGKELEFYKYDGDISQMLQNVRNTLNKFGDSWTRAERDHCLEETEKAIMTYGEILRVMLS